MTGSASDAPEMQKHVYSKQEKQTLERRFKDPNDPLKVVIVRDMWLTGFDAPCCNTMYIDKPMQGHNLMQAIARVNRVFRNKSRENGGLIVDYVGIADELKKLPGNTPIRKARASWRIAWLMCSLNERAFRICA